MTEDPVFPNRKGIVHRAPSQRHGGRGSALVHVLKSLFIHVPVDGTSPAGRTLRLEGASATHLGSTQIGQRPPTSSVSGEVVSGSAL